MVMLEDQPGWIESSSTVNHVGQILYSMSLRLQSEGMPSEKLTLFTPT